LNTSSNLGNSLGTAIIGVLLLVSVYSALGAAVEKAYPDQVTAQDVKENLPGWVDTLKTANPPAVKGDQNTTTQIVDETLSTAMQPRLMVSRSSCLLDFSSHFSLEALYREAIRSSERR
jgi:hypothetical protein